VTVDPTSTPGRPPASLTDVARVAGVSVAAASRALNARPGVRPEIRARVQAVAAELRYRPHGAARDLALGESSVIGLLLPDLDRTIPPFWAWVHRHLCAVAAEQGVGVMVYFLDDIAEHLGESLVAKAWRGAVVAPDAAHYRFVRDLHASGFPIVLIGAPVEDFDVPSVDVENVSSSAGAVHHLLDIGCTRIGVIAGPADRVESRLRVEGYHRALAEAGVAVDPSLVIHADYTVLGSADAARHLIDHGVDGIFATSDPAAIATSWTAQRLGIDVPNELAVVGFDGLQSDVHDVADLTSVVQPVDALTRAAMRMLARVGRGGPPERVVIEPELVVRGSTRRLAKPAR
jgi:LacI family transcriptional regulator